jgi:hypothetical protein
MYCSCYSNTRGVTLVSDYRNTQVTTSTPTDVGTVQESLCHSRREEEDDEP